MEANNEILIATISKFPDARFSLSTEPGGVLYEAELREELKRRHPSMVVEEFIYRVKRLT